jgi:hypothetical protein
MMGTGHRLTAAAGWMATAAHLGLPGWQVAAGIPVAVAFSAGPTSPDVDNTRVWKKLDKWIPDEVLGDGGPLGHRELLHWWGLPAIVAVVLQAVGGPWYAWAAVLGWASHLAGDLVFGQAGYGTPQGIPLGPWWWHLGLGLKCGGLTERALVPVAAAAVVWWAAGTPGGGMVVEALGRVS